jgi:hypothetical protein
MVRNGYAVQIPYTKEIDGDKLRGLTLSSFGDQGTVRNRGLFECNPGFTRLCPLPLLFQDMNSFASTYNLWDTCKWCFVMEMPGPNGYSDRRKKRAAKFRRKFDEASENIRRQHPEHRPEGDGLRLLPRLQTSKSSNSERPRLSLPSNPTPTALPAQGVER